MKCFTKPISPCPQGVINAKCVVYTGANLVNIGANTNDRLDVILAKIDESVGDFFFNLFIQDSESIHLSGDGSNTDPLTADIKISASANNAITLNSDGIYTPQVISTGLLTGGIITWISGYTYDVSAANYNINGVNYNSAATQITLDAADPTFDRIDVVVVDTNGDVLVLTGSPSEDPQAPSIDPSSQLALSFILVTANTVEPVIPQVWIYQEGVEWTPASSTPRIDPVSPNNPSVGSFAIEATLAQNGDNVTLTAPSAPIMSLYNVFIFKIRSKANWGSSSLSFRFRVAGTPVGISVDLSHGVYGFDSSNTTTYQTISIPTTSFGLVALPDDLRLTVNTSTTLGFYIDEIQLQEGVVNALENIYHRQGGDIRGTTSILGTNDNQDISIVTGALQRAKVLKTGHVLINKTTPITLAASSGPDTLTPILQATGTGIIDKFVVGPATVDRTMGASSYVLQVQGNTYFSGANPTISAFNTRITVEATSSVGQIVLTGGITGSGVAIEKTSNEGQMVRFRDAVSDTTNRWPAFGYKRSPNYTNDNFPGITGYFYAHNFNQTAISDFKASRDVTKGNYIDFFQLGNNGTTPTVITQVNEVTTRVEYGSKTELYPNGVATGKIIIGSTTNDGVNILQVTGGVKLNGLATDNTATQVLGKHASGHAVWRDVSSIAGGGGGSGTVTSVSVVNANGFDGSVATATTTPAITLSTTITGILKGNGTAISAATPGTDYLTVLSGDVTTSANVATIANDAVTYAKIQNVTQARILGRYTASTGDVQEITVGSGLTLDSGTGVLAAVTGGGGTVTSFSAGDLSPLFTTSEATVTTTPALTFSLTNAGANTYFGNATGSTGTPSYTAAAALTKTDDTNVTLTLGGAPNTSLLSATSLTLGWTGQLSMARGGTGTALSDPNADRVLFWDDSAGAITWLTMGTGLAITGTTLDSTGGGGSGTVSSGVAGSLATYPSTGTTVDDLAMGTANQIVGLNNAGSGHEYKTISTGTTAVSNNIGVTLSGANAIVIQIPDASATDRGAINTGTQSIAGAKTFLSAGSAFNALLNLTAGFTTGTATAANMYVPSGSTATAMSHASVLFGGASSVASRVFVNGSTNYVITANNSAANMIIAEHTYTEAASGTHALIAGLVLKAPVVTDNAGAATTNMATLYINAAPSGITPTGKSYAIWSDAGLNRFDGLFNAGGTDLTANQIWGANAGATAMEGKSFQSIGGTVTITYPSAGVINLESSGSGLSDGDKGDITVSSSGTVWTVDNSAITLAKIQNIATASFLGRTTASTGVTEVLTGTQATALLDVFTTSVKGLVPAATGGSTTTQFLRKDGTWQVPSGSGAVDSVQGTANQVIVNGTTGSAQTGAITLTLPQDIATGSAVRFAFLGIGGNASATLPIILDPTSTPTSATDAAVVTINGTLTEYTTGTHSLMAGLHINPPTVVTGAATVTNAATLYITSQPGFTVSGANYALFIDAGLARFDGGISTGTGGTLTLPTVAGTIVQYAEATTASSSTPSPAGDDRENFLDVTALAAGATFAAPSGTAANHNKLTIRIKDNGTARSLTWNAIYRGGSTVALPSTTIVNETMYVDFIYNSADTKWDCVGVAQGY